MINSSKIFFKSLAVIAVMLLTFTTTGKVTFASEAAATPETTNLTTISTEAPATDYLVDVKDMLIAPLDTDAFSPKVIVSSPEQEQKVGPLSVVGPVWVTTQWDVIKTGTTVDATWRIATDTIIRSVSASFNTGGKWTPEQSFKGPNTGGVTLSQTWTYYTPGTYKVGAVAQIMTDVGPASCFVGPTVVVIF
ncbi:hypothetical protein J7E73_27640 [Paenibacillus albidus]|uniref:hypothetical protein n=1 Tax=Paenibacillus albidus TaxID=2041023 RepID=UPI001BEBF30C|nr:hypothetical protein [Paenibacillus albidus]MBT2292835.1 hypothetical protein [Paenibacillus albidus]